MEQGGGLSWQEELFGSASRRLATCLQNSALLPDSHPPAAAAPPPQTQFQPSCLFLPENSRVFSRTGSVWAPRRPRDSCSRPRRRLLIGLRWWRRLGCQPPCEVRWRLFRHIIPAGSCEPAPEPDRLTYPLPVLLGTSDREGPPSQHRVHVGSSFCGPRRRMLRPPLFSSAPP